MKIFIDIDNSNVEIITDASEDVAPNLKIETSLTQPGNTVFFEDNFRFGFSILDGPQSIYSCTYPQGFEKYVSTDQEIFSTDYVNEIKPDHEYALAVWCLNGINTIEKIITFNTSNAGQPFPSWSFNEDLKTWKSPKPMPEQGVDGVFYVWSEENQDWIQKI